MRNLTAHYFPFATLAVLLLTACSNHEEGTAIRDEAAANSIFLFGNSSEPPSLDPHINTANNGNRIITTLIEGLVTYHPSNDNIAEPGVAESWTHVDNTIWTFNLRKNARWSNGDPVTAHDFLYGYERMLHPDLGAKYAQLLYLLKNARQFNEGTLSDFSQVGAKALDDHTLEITLEGPTPYFLGLIKHHSWHPVHPPTVEAAGGMTKPDSTWTRDNYVGNGPYRLKEWVISKIIKVEKSPTYWDAEKVSIQEVHFLPIDDINTEDQMYNAGSLHYQNTIPTHMYPIYQKEGDPHLRVEPWIGSYFYRINTTEPHMADKRVRQALSLAINRRAITKRILKGAHFASRSITPNGIEGYEPPQTADFNPKKARQLLAEAGYPNGEGFPTSVLLFNSSEQHKQIAEAVQQMWLNILGIQVELRNQEWKTYLETVINLDYDVARAAWIGDYVYPDTFLTMFRTGDGNNNTGWSNPTYDRLVTDSMQESDPQKRLSMLAEAEALLMDELPIIPIYHYARNYRIDPAVKGWYPKLTDNRNYKHLRLEKTP
ncbi:peptide ABC transporter substrate-binding protein [Pelagicoccus mobilis]|uniref:Peptide ABC transporter substrate-binding protein n=1 Tax=Pelagicoccus mobilis TaxID=415221 RepID=A0A934RZ70_9BACT|nr:peptide ABC transporter substrate-binding protein [Pelagicoccus mobilis]MBK1877994.1 peptide ABC transporter substrate-binding protein [Pelagicoccus mobilis]